LSAPTLRKPRRPLAVGTLLVLSALVAALVSPGSSRPLMMHPAAATTPTHPYSNPVWWPVHAATFMGCYHGNATLNVKPGQETCRTNADGTPDIQHKVWALDIPSQTRRVNDPKEGVYAAGGGIVHVGASGWHCTTTSSNSRGNWLWIDHGNGVSSQYGHLGTFTVKAGQFVRPGQQIATIGNSGYSRCATVNDMRYLWFGVKTGGSAGPYVDFKTLKVCAGRTAVRTWPTQLPNNRGWRVFNDVPSRQPLPRLTAGSSCIDQTPNTPNKPAGQRLVPSGSQRLMASWNQPTSGPRPSVIVVQLQQWHPTIHKWLDLRSNRVSGTSRSTAFTGLASRKIFRMRVWFGNAVGWSLPSYWTANAKTR
jgi:hypothetical protein